MFDTHAHLYDEDDFEQIYNDAQAVNVNRILLASTNFEDCQRYINLANLYKNVYCGIGMHPHDAEHFTSIDPFRKIASINLNVVKAVSEVGLDYFYDYADREKQRNVFDKFIDLANELNLPLVLHCRNAEEDCYQMLKAKPIKAGLVVHCFTGNVFWAQKFVELGAYFSIGGIITFNKANDVREMFEVIPTDRIILETDSPYLAPVPFRGKRNQPAYLTGTVSKIAQLRNLSREEVIAITDINACNIFNIDNK